MELRCADTVEIVCENSMRFTRGDLDMSKTQPFGADRCLNCGEYGSHFAPPSLGEPGFFICKEKSDDKEEPKTYLTKEEIPHPGSEEAIKMGCACPVLDNHHGQGFTMNGKTCFWITEGCPIHVKPKEEKEDDPSRQS